MWGWGRGASAGVDALRLMAKALRILIALR